VPIYAEETVLDRAGVLLDRDSGSTFAGQSEPLSQIGPEELEKMSAFKDFIDTLDLDDFEKRNQA
jgi:hypothetical protein